MAAKPLPPQVLLKRLFVYDSETGDLIWRERPKWMFEDEPPHYEDQSERCRAWNERYAGKTAGHSNKRGDNTVIIFGTGYIASRVIWKLVHDEEAVTIDHINRDPSDNRLANLRSVTHHENCLNRGAPRNSVSGVSGVRWSDRRKHWVVTITKRGRAHYVGQFLSVEDAIAARRLAEKELGFYPAAV